MGDTDESSDLQQRARKRLGTTLRGKYRIDSVLGIGGMAVVYKATHRNQAEFAIKMLHPELSVHDDIRKRFLREGYAANSVKHPGVVKVVDDDVAEDGAAFLVMEILHGASVEAIWQKENLKLPVEAAVAITHQALEVLAATHDKGIVHRDIKPGNLFVANDGSLKVLDFGIARVRDALASGKRTTTMSGIFGTPAFMAPEHAAGKLEEIDGQSDLWAVGATLYSLVSGHIVHEAPTVQLMLVRATTYPAPSLASVTTGIHPAIISVVDRALAFDKADRWPSAQVMREALAAASMEAFGSIPSRDTLVPLAMRAVAKSLRTFDSVTTVKKDPRAVDASAFAPTRMVTPAPAASDSQRRRARRTLVVAIGTFLTVTTAGGAVLVAMSSGQAQSLPSASASLPPPSVVPTASATSSPPAIVTGISPDLLPPSIKPTAKQPVVVAPSASAKVSCDPPYSYDSQGLKVFKIECMPK